MVLGLVIVSCNSDSNDQTRITDRIWRSEGNQYYLNSSDSIEYLWLTLRYEKGQFINLFSEAEGTPETKPMPKQYSGNKVHGWQQGRRFSISNNTLVLSKDGEEYTFNYKAGKDTVIDGQAHNQMLVYTDVGFRRWVSPVEEE